MESQTVRISKDTHATLRQLAEKAGASMTAILEAAVRGLPEDQVLGGV